MATSTIKANAHWGAYSMVTTLPWTAPCDGMLFCYLSASGATNSYGQVSGDQTYRISAHNGHSTSAAFPITKGEVISNMVTGTGDNFYLHWRPLYTG